jgi:hypothetical protein
MAFLSPYALVRSLKLSNLERSKYYGGGPRGKRLFPLRFWVTQGECVHPYYLLSGMNAQKTTRNKTKVNYLNGECCLMSY